ncbi:MAG: LysR family transcriptional regulator [Pseudomonadota bacterium]
MSIRQLRTLVAIADTKTFSAAARATHVTHAAVSQQMQSLEAELGVTLFNRAKRTPELTPLGHQIVIKARELIEAYDTLVPSVLADGGLSGTIKLGAIGTTLTGLMPNALAVLKAQYPQIGLHIRPGLTGPMLADIERGLLDAAIITKPQVLPSWIVFQRLTTEQMHVIASVEESETDPVRLLRERPFIRFNRTAVLGALIDAWIMSKDLMVHEAMELDSAEAIASMVAANLGVSIVPDTAVPAPQVAALKHLSLGTSAPTRVLGLVHHKDGIKTRALDGLYSALRTTLENAAPKKGREST